MSIFRNCTVLLDKLHWSYQIKGKEMDGGKKLKERPRLTREDNIKIDFFLTFC